MLTEPVLWDVKTHLDDAEEYTNRPKTVAEAELLAATLGYQRGSKGDGSDFLQPDSSIKGFYVYRAGKQKGVSFFGPGGTDDELSAPSTPSYDVPTYFRPTLSDASPTAGPNLATILQELVDQPTWSGRSKCDSPHGCRNTAVWPTFTLTRAAGWGLRDIQAGLYCEHTGCYGNGRFHSLKVEYCSCSVSPAPTPPPSCTEAGMAGTYVSVDGQVVEKAKQSNPAHTPNYMFGGNWNPASMSAFFKIDVNDPSVSTFSYFHPPPASEYHFRPLDPADMFGHYCTGSLVRRDAHPHLPHPPAGACQHTFSETYEDAKQPGRYACWHPGPGSFFTLTAYPESDSNLVEWAWYTDDDVEMGKPGPTLWRRGTLSNNNSMSTTTWTTQPITTTTTTTAAAVKTIELCKEDYLLGTCIPKPEFDSAGIFWGTHAIFQFDSDTGGYVRIRNFNDADCTNPAYRDTLGKSNSYEIKPGNGECARRRERSADTDSAYLAKLARKRHRNSEGDTNTGCAANCIKKEVSTVSSHITVGADNFGPFSRRDGEMHLFETGCRSEEYILEFEPIAAALKSTIVSASLSVQSSLGTSGISGGFSSTLATPLPGPLRVAIRGHLEDSDQVVWDLPEMGRNDKRQYVVGGLESLVQAQVNRPGWRANTTRAVIRLGRRSLYSGWGSRVLAIWDRSGGTAQPATQLSVAYCDCSAAAAVVTEAIDSLLDTLSFITGGGGNANNEGVPCASPGACSGTDEEIAAEVAQAQVDSIVDATNAAAEVIAEVEPADAFALMEGGALNAIANSFGAAIASLSIPGGGGLSQLGGAGVPDGGSSTNATEAAPSLVESVETFASTLVAQALAFNSSGEPAVIEDPTGLMTITWATPAPKPVAASFTFPSLCGDSDFDFDEAVASVISTLKNVGVPDEDLLGGNATCGGVAAPSDGAKPLRKRSRRRLRDLNVELTLKDEFAATVMFKHVSASPEFLVSINGGAPVGGTFDTTVAAIVDKDAVEGVESVTVDLKKAFATVPFPENATQKAVIIVYYEASNDTEAIFPTDAGTAELSDGVDVASTPPKLASPVLSISIPEGEDGKAGVLAGNLTYTLQVSNEDEPDADTSVWEKAGKCVWWDFNKAQTDGSVGAWATEGCELQEVAGLTANDTRVTCSCSHMTHFAVLFSVGAERSGMTEQYTKALEVISYVGGSFGLLGLALTFVVFGMAKDLVKRPEKIIMNLAAALFLGLFIFLAGTSRREDVAARNDLSCAVTAAFLHYFFLASWSWQFVEGLHLYHKFIKVFGEEMKFRWCIIIGWGGPLLFVLPSVLAFPDKYGTDEMCFLDTSSKANYLLTVPVGIILVANSAMMLYILTSIRKHVEGSVAAGRAQVKAVMAFGATLGLVYIFGALNMIRPNKPLEILFALGVGVQGCFIFYFHVYQKDEFKKRIHERVGGTSSGGTKSKLNLKSRSSVSKRRSTSAAGGASVSQPERSGRSGSMMDFNEEEGIAGTEETTFATNAHYYPGAGMSDNIHAHDNVHVDIMGRTQSFMKSSVPVVKRRPSFISEVGAKDRAAKFAHHGHVDL